jgi:hypothetical protein
VFPRSCDTNLKRGSKPKGQIIGNSGALNKHHTRCIYERNEAESGYMRRSGLRGGTMGGPGGLLRGSIAGFGICLLNGSMIMGGMAGGADGGFL